MDLLLNPNIAYILLVGATLLALMAMAAPGSGVIEVSAVFCFVLAAYSIYHLSFNWWALVVVVASLVPFFIALGRPGRERWLIVSMIGMILGSLFLFPAGPLRPSVNPFVAIVTSLVYGGFVWFCARKVMEISRTKPSNDLSSLVGQTGTAKTLIQLEGSVQVAGELWSARSAKPIPAGSAVRVLARKGFVLIVENEALVQAPSY